MSHRAGDLARVKSGVTAALAVLVLLAAGLLGASGAEAQVPGAPSSSVSIAIDVETFGVGEVVRPGELGGIRVALTDTAVRPREVAVRLSSKDVDGDSIQAERFVTLNPGQPMGVWLYWSVPASISAGSIFTVSVHEATSIEGGGFTVGRQLAARPIQPSEVVSSTTSLLGVVGLGSLIGLDQLEQTLNPDTSVNARHGQIRIVSGLTPVRLPDDFKGLASLDALIWKGGDPNELSVNQVRAIEQWVRMGGHLVIPLRSVGVESLIASPLAPLLPEVEIRRFPGVDLERYRTLLTDDEATELSGRLPSQATVHELAIDPETEPANATCILSGNEGCVVARRLVGVGRVTLIGVDLASRDLARIVQPDRFWNRVLGLRGDLPPGARRAAAPFFNMGVGGSSTANRKIDTTLVSDIAKSRAAGLGILLGLIVFVSYWLVAGPVGFSLLKARSWQQHAWVAFVGVALAFTVVSWVSVNAAKPNEVEMRHVTLLRHVYGQPQQRARLFASVLLPEYGEQRVSVGDPSVDSEWRQALWPLMPPGADSGNPFPDARAYQIDARRMDSVEFPARSTMKQIRAEWLGGPRWTMPFPASPETAPALSEDGEISGALVHDLPVALEDVHLILIQGQTSEEEELEVDGLGRRGRLRAVGLQNSLPSPWMGSVPLDLESIFGPSSGAESLISYLRNQVPRDTGFSASASEIDEPERSQFIAFFSQLEPKDYTLEPSANARHRARLFRELTHGFDLGVWFTEPCLIILGTARGVASPVPVFVDGRAVGADDPELNDGRVHVQWVYPLRGQAPVFTNPPELEVDP